MRSIKTSSSVSFRTELAGFIQTVDDSLQVEYQMILPAVTLTLQFEKDLP